MGLPCYECEAKLAVRFRIIGLDGVVLACWNPAFREWLGHETLSMYATAGWHRKIVAQ